MGQMVVMPQVKSTILILHHNIFDLEFENHMNIGTCIFIVSMKCLKSKHVLIITKNNLIYINRNIHL